VALFLKKQDVHVVQHASGPAGHNCSSSEPPACTKITEINGHACKEVLPPSAGYPIIGTLDN